MESNRKVGLTAIPIFIFIFSSGILCRWFIAPPENPKQLLWAIPIGGVTGLMVCVYLYVVWDPKTLTSKGQNWGASGCLLPFAVIGGTVFARITASFLSHDFSQLLAAPCCGRVFVMAVAGVPPRHLLGQDELWGER
ncbi:MAG: hypothetical protein IPJ90_07705 [Anaerolineaceae bacterium]|nr:hypothetical protein [Anaerolineaceae bacterium]